MLKQLDIRNLTVFREASLLPSAGVNEIVGVNGSGKTHLLKSIYATIAASAEEGRKPGTVPTKGGLQTKLAEKLVAVFRPESLGRLARRKQGRERCELRFRFDNPGLDIAFSFATSAKAEVNVDTVPSAWIERSPVFFPTRELLTIYPGFVSVYENHYLEFEETWRDTCLLLGAPSLRGPREKQARELLSPIEQAMGGEVALDRNGRFYLHIPGQGTMEMPLVAEGVRKLGMVARLIATGSLLDKGYLFWDEPETNLNPQLIVQAAKTIHHLASKGIQVFVATHSLFLMKELHILREQSGSAAESRVFALQLREGAVEVEQGETFEDVGSIAALDEELAQSGRFLEAGVAG